MAKVTTSIQNWDFNSKHVQQNLEGGDFIGSHTVILCATAPRLSDLTAGALGGNNDTSKSPLGTYQTEASAGANNVAFAIPIGVVSDFTVQQQRQVQQVFEIGSKRSYFVSARNITSLSLTRVFFHGPSLLRMLYAYYPADKLGAGAGNVLRDNPSCPDTQVATIGMKEDSCANLPSIKSADLAGYDNFFINLASTLFSQPIGLVMYIRDNANNDVGTVFFEECNIDAHQMGFSQNAVVLAEGIQIRCDRIVPIRANVARSAQAAANNVSSTLSPNSIGKARESLESAGGSIADSLGLTGLAQAAGNVIGGITGIA